MRRTAWLAAMVVASALVLPAGPAGAQVTVPIPDFNGDGFGDLGVGVPGEDVGAVADAGALSVLYGSGGAMAGDGQVLTQDTAGVPGTSEAGDRFGAALVAGRFNADEFWDLAVGAPGEDLGAGDTDAGAVTILFGSAGGLTGAGARLITQANPEAGDSFGFALEVGELEGGGEHLLVGVPGEDVGAAAGAGAVSVFSDPGTLADEQLLFQGGSGVAGTAESGDAFGWALASNDYNDSEGIDSLAVGAPGEDVGAVADAGAVVVQYAPGFGGPVGLSLLTQDRPEAGDRFGSALADGFLASSDGTVDLAVGAPGETVGGAAAAGAVSVIENDDAGFLPGGRVFYQGAAGVPGVAETGDLFGTAVAVGGFGENAGGLAVGAPGEDIGAAADAGILAVLYGLDGVGTELLDQQDTGGAVEAGDLFGAALSDSFFHQDDVLGDLGVGAPGETVGGRPAAGAGSVLFGAVAGGLGDGGSQFFFQGSSGLGGLSETGDAFAGGLA